MHSVSSQPLTFNRKEPFVQLFPGPGPDDLDILKKTCLLVLGALTFVGGGEKRSGFATRGVCGLPGVALGLPGLAAKGCRFRETVKNALKRNRRSLLSLHSFSAVFGQFSKGRYILLLSRVFSLFCWFLSAEHGVNPPYHNEWMKTV